MPVTCHCNACRSACPHPAPQHGNGAPCKGGPPPASATAVAASTSPASAPASEDACSTCVTAFPFSPGSTQQCTLQGRPATGVRDSNPPVRPTFARGPPTSVCDGGGGLDEPGQRAGERGRVQHVRAGERGQQAQRQPRGVPVSNLIHDRTTSIQPPGLLRMRLLHRQEHHQGRRAH